MSTVAHRTATAIATTRTPALPDSVRRKVLNGATRSRAAHSVMSLEVKWVERRVTMVPSRARISLGWRLPSPTSRAPEIGGRLLSSCFMGSPTSAVHAAVLVLSGRTVARAGTWSATAGSPRTSGLAAGPLPDHGLGDIGGRWQVPSGDARRVSGDDHGILKVDVERDNLGGGCQQDVVGLEELASVLVDHGMAFDGGSDVSS